MGALLHVAARCARTAALCFAALALGFPAGEEDALGEARALASCSLTVPITAELPSEVKLKLSVDGETLQAERGGTLRAYAGKEISGVDVVLTASGRYFSGDDQRLKFVYSSVTAAQASAAGACLALAGAALDWDQVGAPFSEEAGVETSKADCEQTLRSSAWGGFAFAMGGVFRACYSDDGSFGFSHADLVPVALSVWGVFSDCESEGSLNQSCVAIRPTYCFASLLNHSSVSSCAVSLNGTGEGYTGSPGRIAWSALWEPSWNRLTGLSAAPEARACASSLPDASRLCPPEGSSDPSCLLAEATTAAASATPRLLENVTSNESTGTDASETNASETNGEPAFLDATGDLAMMRPQSLTKVTRAFTLAACYCPALGGCDNHTDFVQQVGMIYIFASKLCDAQLHGADAAACSSFAGYGGAASKHAFSVMVYCAPGDGGCPATDTSRILLADASPGVIAPSWDEAHPCRTAARSARLTAPAAELDLYGGDRQDWKFFGGGGPSERFVFAGLGAADTYEALSFHGTSLIDVCFCQDDCGNSSSWFVVGRVAHSPYRLHDLGQRQAVAVGVTGALALHRGWADQMSLGISSGSKLKILYDPSASMGDSQCANEAFDTRLVPELTNVTSASEYAGYEDTSEDGSIVFNGGVRSRGLHFTKPGIMALCYCRLLSCAVTSSDWVLAARYVVRGPSVEHAWTMSVGIRVRLDIRGFDLRASDTLRIIDEDSTCTAAGGNPTAAGIEVGCPDACRPAGVENNLAIRPLGHDAVRCNASNAACATVYVRRVRVVDGSSSEVVFDGDPALQTGDRIVLEGLLCGAHCDETRLAAVQGLHAYGTGGVHRFGVVVTTTQQANRILIAVGWAGGASVLPQFLVPSAAGAWRRLSAASTAEELRTAAPASGLRVCWGSGGSGSYGVQIGILAFVQAPALDVELALTAKEAGVVAPVLVRFRTGARDYAGADGTTEVRIVFLDVAVLEPRMADEGALYAEEWRDGVEPSMASLGACGRLFLELWAPDAGGGFPLPQGCRHRLAGGTAELIVVFNAQNGLRPGVEYQLVINALGSVGLLELTPIVEVRCMGDIEEQPYLMLEVGSAATGARLSRSESSYLREDGNIEHGTPRFYGAGLEVMGGSGGALEIQGEELDLLVRLNGDPNNQIVGGSILRLFMFPLTQWNMTSTDEVATYQAGRCLAFSTGGVIGECSVQSVAQAGVKLYNIIMVELPNVDMAPISGTVTNEVRVTTLTLPRGGFFPTRIGAQISTGGDRYPAYVTSTAAFLWKSPSSVATFAALVTRAGDGNAAPFKGDAGNVLHARLRPGASLFVASHPGASASLSVRMPAGYECDGVSAAGVARPLGVLEGNLANRTGRGLLDPARWRCSGALCVFSLRLGELVPAGADLIVSFTVRNPTSPLVQGAEENQWYLDLTGTGGFPAAQEAAPHLFNGSGEPAGSVDRGDFGSSVSVLGRLGAASMQPTSFKVSEEHYLHIFFCAEQSSGGGGSGLMMVAPLAFDFGHPCDVGDLDLAYYAKDMTGQVYGLPEVARCESRISTDGTVQEARIHMAGALHAGRHYAFSMRITNTASYAPSDITGWHLWTMAQDDALVDAVAATLALNPLFAGGPKNTQVSFGVYQKRMLLTLTPPQVRIHVAPLLPYTLTGEEATVTVFPLSTLETIISSSFRLLAPAGYIWVLAGKVFSATAAGATAPMPGGTPSCMGNALMWPAANYLANQTYGFAAKVRVPDRSPTKSSNAFFLEFGYQEATTSGSERPLSTRVDGPAVRALRNVFVDYSSNVHSQVSIMRFTVELITFVPNAGGLRILVPTGFAFPESCVPEPIAGSTATALPSSVACAFTAGSSPQLTLVAGAAGLQPALYGFELPCTNPTAPAALLEDTSTPCGVTSCWTFQSLSSLSADGRRLVVEQALDARADLPGFAVNEAMPMAYLADLGGLNPSATRRNDQPLQSNMLTFAFRLSKGMDEAGDLVLRGPLGFVFSDDCLTGGGVITDLAGFFGDQKIPTFSIAVLEQQLASNLAASSYESVPWWMDAWEDGLPVEACAGAASVARLRVGAGLAGKKLYAFAIRLRANPERTPAQNRWTLEAPGESSAPFDSFNVWTFSHAAVSSVITAARWADREKAEQVPNLVNITFRPYHDVSGEGGMLVLKVPENFSHPALGQWGPCPFLLEERNVISGPALASEASVAFAAAGLACEVASSGEVFKDDILKVRLNSSHGLIAGLEYTLVVDIYYPDLPDDATSPPRRWHLESFAADGTALDAVSIPGPAVTPPGLAWAYDSEEIRMDGLAPILLLLTMMFPNTLDPEHTILITAPLGYSFNSPGDPSQCNSLQWGPFGAAPIMASSEVTCSDNELFVVVNEASSVSMGTLVELRIATANPPKPPPVALRYWTIEHRAAEGDLLSSMMLSSWPVVPRLADVQIGLLGREIAAGSTGVLEIRFVALSQASSLTVVAQSPLGFSFSAVRLLVEGQELIYNDAPVASIRFNIPPDVPLVVQFSDVLLGRGGGPTTFDLTTFTSGGSVADRSVGVAAFRLPGGIAISDAKLESEYNQAVAVYPLKSLWRARVGEAAIASFTLTFSIAVGANSLLRVRGAPFMIASKGLSFTEASTGESVPSHLVEDPSTDGELQISLDAGLLASTPYRAVMGVTAPSTLQNKDVHWVFETIDGGSLPSAIVNYTLGAEFRLVSFFAVTVTAQRSPPLSDIEVQLTVHLGGAQPTFLRLFAPPGFTFAASCLVAGSGGSQVEACSRDTPVFGRSVALIACKEDGAEGSILGLKLLVSIPAGTPSVRSWLLDGRVEATNQQVGWGQDGDGVDVVQMQDVSVVYAALVATKGYMAFCFRAGDILERGGQVQVVYPPEYVLGCTGLHEVSLPGVLDCNTDVPGSLFLTLNGTLVEGDYAFLVAATTPQETPVPNQFSVLLLDTKGNVRDAAMGVSGMPLQQGIYASAGPLLYTSSEAQQASIITVGFDVTVAIERNVVSAVLITLPENFVHNVGGSDGLVISNEANEAMRLQVQSVDTSVQDRLTILMDTTLSVPEGRFRFSFPATVPQKMPAYNVWQVTLCRNRNTTGVGAACTQAYGPGALVTFPVPGFRHSDAPVGSAAAARARLDSAASGAARQCGPSVVPVALATLLLAVVAVVPRTGST